MTAAGDKGFAAECSERLLRAQRSFEERLWNGAYYRLWNDVQQPKVSEVCLANQLMAQWCVRIAGLKDVLPSKRVAPALDRIDHWNMKATSYGLINGVTAEGKPFNTKFHKPDFGLNIFVGENLCVAMTFLYYGRRDTGLEIARRLYDVMAVKRGPPGTSGVCSVASPGCRCGGTITIPISSCGRCRWRCGENLSESFHAAVW